MDNEKFKELMYQALETEKGGVKIYETALRCARNKDLKEEWTEYHSQTKEHVEIVQGLMKTFGFDAEDSTPGSELVKKKGESLIEVMEDALSKDPAAAELVAAECVVDAETKDHMNWELLAEAQKELEGEQAAAVKEAVEKVEEQEDKHLYHTIGWTRELWLDSIGLPAVLPPPEEVEDVDTEEGAAKARSQRGRMIRSDKPRGKQAGKSVKKA